jgi:hypothetical protein
LTYAGNNTAPLLENILSAIHIGYIKNDVLTIPQVKKLNLQLGWGMTKRAIEGGFKQGIETFFTKLAIENTNTSMAKNGKKVSHRKADEYLLMSPDQINENLPQLAYSQIVQDVIKAKDDVLAMPEWDMIHDGLSTDGKKSNDCHEIALTTDEYDYLNSTKEQLQLSKSAQRRVNEQYRILKQSLSDDTCTMLENVSYRNAKEYRVLFARAIARKLKGKPCSYTEWQRILGVSHGSISTILDAAGIKNHRQYAECPIENAHNIADNMRLLQINNRGWAETWVIIGDGHYEEIPISRISEKANEKTVALAIANNHEIRLKIRTASIPEIIRDEPYAPPEPDQDGDQDGIEPITDNADVAACDVVEDPATVLEADDSDIQELYPEKRDGKYSQNWLISQWKLRCDRAGIEYSQNATFTELVILYTPEIASRITRKEGNHSTENEVQHATSD